MDLQGNVFIKNAEIITSLPTLEKTGGCFYISDHFSWTLDVYKWTSKEKKEYDPFKRAKMKNSFFIFINQSNATDIIWMQPA